MSLTDVSDERIENISTREFYGLWGENKLEEWQRLYVVGARARHAQRISEYREEQRRWHH